MPACRTGRQIVQAWGLCRHGGVELEACTFRSRKPALTPSSLSEPSSARSPSCSMPSRVPEVVGVVPCVRSPFCSPPLQGSPGDERHAQHTGPCRVRHVSTDDKRGARLPTHHSQALLGQGKTSYWLVGWLVGTSLVGWLVGWDLVGWLMNYLVGWLAGT